jgi:tetratricopeptide (TPR) repeat protein
MKFLVLLLFIFSPVFLLPTPAFAKDDTPEVIAARKARDKASIDDLKKAIEKAQKEVEETNSFEAYLRLALFQVWMCEAAESHDNKTLFKQAAEAGIAAAEKAVELNPQSSDAHHLLGDLLSQLIPNVFGGGMRYGKRAEEEMDKAIELDPKNVNALVSRAINYYYTPDTFGGDKQKAFEMLKKAVEIDPAADSPHIWLAMFYLDAGKKDIALREINLARKSNPERSFTNYVYQQIVACNKKTPVKKKKAAIKKSTSKKNY